MVFITLLTACCLGIAQATSDVKGLVSLPVARQYDNPSDGVRQRDTVPWDLGNAYVRYGQFTVNISMGNPPQDLVLKVDSASAETWAFGPNACGSASSSCVGGECKRWMYRESRSMRITDMFHSQACRLEELCQHFVLSRIQD